MLTPGVFPVEIRYPIRDAGRDAGGAAGSRLACGGASFADWSAARHDVPKPKESMLSKFRVGAVVLGLCAAACQDAGAATRWISSLDEATGLPTLEAAGERADSAGYAFWGDNWHWADMQVKFEAVAPGSYQTSGVDKALGLTMKMQVRRQPEGGWSVDFVFDAGSGVASAMGGGILFHLDQAAWNATMGDPVLLPDNRGWRWGRDGGPQEEVRFDRPLAGVYFEGGNKSELRAFFFKDKVPPGELKVHATWQYKGGVETVAPLSERLGAAATTWPVDGLGNAGAVPDLSFLNRDGKPAGRHGAVHADKGRLVFADGTPARFWGTNVAAYALFETPHDEVRAQARRLAALGYNLVRLHHMDSPWVRENIFGRYAKLSDTQTLDSDDVDKLDWWIKCLKDEGVYVWLDLHVQRAFKAGDHIEGFDEIRKGKDVADLKGFNYVNPSIEQAMLRFDEQYLTHKNTYTGVAYKDEPAVVGLLLTNENDLVQHGGNGLLPDKNVPLHDKRYMDLAAAFAKDNGLPADKVWRSWEPGPSKLFLNDLEHRFDVSMIAALRRLGDAAPIATTSSWGKDALNALPALTTGNLIDVHTYGRQGTLEKNPLLFPNLADWIGSAHVVGLPLTVSEWNAEPFPTQDRHVLPLYMAATASHQGWDALMHFAYTQEPPSRNSPSNWHSYNDPSLMAMMPAAALLYRERHVAEATSTYVVDLDENAFFGQSTSVLNSPALRTSMELGKLLVAMPQAKSLPWLQRHPYPADAIVIRDPARSFLPPDAAQAVSDTHELKRNWVDGVFTIDTPRTRAALGWIGGKAIALPDVEFDLITRNASVAVQSLDDDPIGTSTNLLVSIGTRSQPQAGNKAPFLVEPAAGSVSLRAPAGLKVYGLDGSGHPAAWPATWRDGRYTITLDGKTPVHWLYVRKAS